jgi:hypothetical protein
MAPAATDPAPPPHRAISTSPPPYKGAAAPPLHPAPLPFSPPSPQQHRRWRTARPPERRLDLLHRCSSFPSEPMVSLPIFPSSSRSLFRAIWSTGTLSWPSSASSAAALPPGRPSPRRPSLACDRGRPMGMDGPDQKGPLDRSTVDRWTRSTAPVDHQPFTIRHVSLHQPFPASCHGSFAKRTPSFRNSQPYPSTYIKAFQSGPFLYA